MEPDGPHSGGGPDPDSLEQRLVWLSLVRREQGRGIAVPGGAITAASTTSLP